MNRPKPKIIYIASNAHSGSTLLDLVIGSAPHVCPVGELMLLKPYLKEEPFNTKHNPEHTDDSGYPAKKSPFWAWFANHQSCYLRATQLDHSFRWSDRLRILVGRTPKHYQANYHNEPLYTDIQAQAEDVFAEPISYIVDSSKTLARLHEILHTTDLDVYVIHLVRDVRGVANSQKGQAILKSAWYWWQINFSLAPYIKTHVAPERHLRLRYEDFVTHPEHYIAEINAFAGIAIDPDTLTEHINAEDSYRFAGNGMRHKSFPGINPDQKWKRRLSRLQQVLLAPLNVFFRA